MSIRGSKTLTHCWQRSATEHFGPEALLALARNQNGLEAPGLQPWHIRVTYQTFDDAGQPKGTGVFEEWWAGPKQYKQSYTGKDFTQTDYVTDTGTYRTGEANFPPLAESLLKMRLLDPIPEIPGDVVFLKRKQAFGSVSLECAVLARKMMNLGSAPTALFPTYCFDSVKPMLRWSGSYGQRNSLSNHILKTRSAYSGGGEGLPYRSQARQRYQLATDRHGFHFSLRRSISAGFASIVASNGLSFGSFLKVSENPLRTP